MLRSCRLLRFLLLVMALAFASAPGPAAALPTVPSAPRQAAAPAQADGIVLPPIPVGTSPAAVAVNPVTNKIYVANASSNTITVIDGATNATTTIAAGTSPNTVAINPVTNKIYVINGGSNNITVVDGATNAMTAWPSGPIPRHWPSTRSRLRSTSPAKTATLR